MFGHITGKVIYKEERELVVEGNDGVGYSLSVLPQTSLSCEIGGTIALWTHLAVKEDALDLYGFTGRSELGLFRLLLSVSGIGPKSALNVLSLADTTTLARAISSGDGAYLTKVSGIGKKLAEKIVLELREKVGEYAKDAGVSHAETEALDALEALGYSPRDTREIVRSFAREHDSAKEIIRRSLQTLGKK
jgi:holliday junction DNA helicase RuvA